MTRSSNLSKTMARVTIRPELGSTILDWPRLSRTMACAMRRMIWSMDDRPVAATAVAVPAADDDEEEAEELLPPPLLPWSTAESSITTVHRTPRSQRLRPTWVSVSVGSTLQQGRQEEHEEGEEVQARRSMYCIHNGHQTGNRRKEHKQTNKQTNKQIDRQTINSSEKGCMVVLLATSSFLPYDQLIFAPLFCAAYVPIHEVGADKNECRVGS